MFLSQNLLEGNSVLIATLYSFVHDGLLHVLSYSCFVFRLIGWYLRTQVTKLWWIWALQGEGRINLWQQNCLEQSLLSHIERNKPLVWITLHNPNARTHTNASLRGRQFKIAISCNPLPGIALQSRNINHASVKIASKLTEMTTQELKSSDEQS